jgi:hypothetical protein
MNELTMSVRMIQFENRWTDLDEIWQVRHTGGYLALVAYFPKIKVG